MRIPVLVFWCLLFLSFNGYAQKPVVKSATEQHWSGGIAGRWGVRYTFSLSFAASEKPIPDTIWIGPDATALIVDRPGIQGNTVVTRSKNKIVWNISASTVHDDNQAPTGNTPALHSPKYEGVALVQYTARGSRRSIAVKKFTTHYPSLSYP